MYGPAWPNALSRQARGRGTQIGLRGKHHGSGVEATAGDPKHPRPPPARKQEQQPRRELKSLNLNTLYSGINESPSKRLMS